MGIKKKTISAFAPRVVGKGLCDERNSGAMAAAVKKRNCLRHVRRPKDSEADYKAEFFVLGQSQAQQRNRTQALARMAGKRHCDERESGAMAAAVKKRNCLRRVRRPKGSEADYKAEFFVLGQSQAQQRRATSLLLPSARERKRKKRRATSLLPPSERERSAKSEEQQAFCCHPSESEAQKAKAKRQKKRQHQKDATVLVSIR